METATQAWADAEQLKEELKNPALGRTERVNRFTETLASRTPTLLFLFGAIIAVIVSASLQLRGRRHASLFIGQWAPSLLLFGLYNKLSKTSCLWSGSDHPAKARRSKSQGVPDSSSQSPSNPTVSETALRFRRWHGFCSA
jgi:hypothetical protein